ncbi:MAG: 50S ribosomal protein L32 [Patescibacteria group bacterium]
MRLSKCSSCGAMHLRHTLCTACGSYRGKKIVDMTALVAKKAEKKQKAAAPAKA